MYIPYFSSIRHRPFAGGKTKPHLFLEMGFGSIHSGLPSIKGSRKAVVEIQTTTMAFAIYFGNPNSFPFIARSILSSRSLISSRWPRQISWKGDVRSK